MNQLSHRTSATTRRTEDRLDAEQADASRRDSTGEIFSFTE